MCLLFASVLTPWVPVGIRLAVIALPSRDDFLIFGPRTSDEKLNIGVMEGL